MSAREEILSRIKSNKPKEVSLDDLPAFNGDASVDAFRNSLEVVSGQSQEVLHQDIEKTIKSLFPTATRIASSVFQGTETINEHSDSATLERIEVAVLYGEFGVAENGAVWVPETNMLNRALPFITQHLVLVVKKEDIVTNMHEAYGRCKAGSYGAFITGPSKTADIEQSLVIGAHGARSLRVLFY